MSQKPKNGGGDASESVASDYTIVDSEAVSWVNQSVEVAVEDSSDWERRPPSAQTLREQNKRLRTIYTDVGLKYGQDAKTAADIAQRRQVALRIRNEQLLKTIKSIALASEVELCFVVDATASMEPHIQGVKDVIHEIVSNLKAAHDANKSSAMVRKLRLGLLAYRDIWIVPRFEQLEFTESVEDFHRFCSGLRAITNGCWADTPEDVLGGLNKALAMNWSSANNTKVLFHIGDAPAHGTHFQHVGFPWPDYYPNGDPNGLTADGIFERISARGIDYYFGKITGCTDTMIARFGDALGVPITQFDVKDVQQILTAVISAVSTSMCHATRKTGASALSERAYRIDPAAPSTWSAHAIQSGTFIAYEFPQSIKDVVEDVPLDRCRAEIACVQVAANPFDRGAERIAFHGRDLRSGKEIVLKEYRRVTSASDSARRHEFANQLQTVAAYFAALFMADCEEKIGVQKLPATLEFLMLKTLALGTPPNFRYMSCEPRLDPNSRYVRFTNNTKFVIPEATFAANGVTAQMVHFVVAFSHYTFTMTGGKLMVVDLQGIIKPAALGCRLTVQLTDPAIHCEDPTRFGSTNAQMAGMSMFFESHVCNEFCAALGLPKVDAKKLLKK